MSNKEHQEELVRGTARIGPPEFAEYLERLRSVNPGLAEQFRGFDGITHVLDWMKQRDVGRDAIDIVGQDEFSYDFLIHLRPNGGWLVFGVN
jgi:hypothetical protein